MRELTHADKMDAVRRATSGLTRRFGDELANGATDERLTSMLADVLGLGGGSGGPDRTSVSYNGSGLRIWCTWGANNVVLDEPILAGQQTVKAVRELYRIPNPEDDQLNLF